jgi:hypothetical protein
MEGGKRQKAKRPLSWKEFMMLLFWSLLVPSPSSHPIPEFGEGELRRE